MVVAKGLNNPRGLAVAADGSVYVAEAGRAGSRCFKFPGEGEEAEETCFGFSGAITRIADGHQERAYSGFISAGGKDGSFTVGVDDVDVGEDGRVYAIMSSGGPETEEMFGARAARQSGKILRLTKGGYKATVGAVDQFEFAKNPDRGEIDSNPYSLAVAPDRTVVADAGGNSLLSVTPSGKVTLLAVFGDRTFGGKPVDPVPTSVALGPDGAFYVGELGGEGQPNGKSRVWRVVPGKKPTVYATGFTTIVGVDVGSDGSVYVVELLKKGFAAFETGDFTGSLIRIAPNGTRRELAKGKLIAPGGVAVGPESEVYVTTNSVFPGQGQVLRIVG